MAVTQKELSPNLGKCEWSLVRTRVDAASEWHRWLIRVEATGEIFRFGRLDEVDRFWRSSFHAHVGMVERAAVMAGWMENDARGDAVQDWLAGADSRLPPCLRESVRAIPVSPVPRRWRTSAMRLGRLAPPGGHELRGHVRDAVARQARTRLDGVLDRAFDHRPSRRL